MHSTNPKSQHYVTALSSALLRGAWGNESSSPDSAADGTIKAPNGKELGWQEGVRKWGKHAGGDMNYIHSLRNISISYLSAQAQSRPGNFSSTDNDLHNVQHSPHQTPSTINDPIPASSASDGSNRSRETAGSNSFVSVPSGGGRSRDSAITTGTVGTSGSSFVHIGTSRGEGEAAGIALGPVIGQGEPSLLHGERLSDPGSDATEIDLHKRIADDRSSFTVTPTNNPIPVSATSAGPPVTSGQTESNRAATHPSNHTTESHDHDTISRLEEPRHPSNSPTRAAPSYLSPAYLDGDDSEESILSCRQGWWSDVNDAGRRDELVQSMKSISEVSRSGKLSATMSRLYAILLAYHHHALADQDSAIATLERIDWKGKMDTTGADTGLSLVAQRVDWNRGMTIYGLCLELVGRPEDALVCYERVIKMFADIPGITLPLSDTFLIPTPESISSKSDKVLPAPTQRSTTRSTATFKSHREAHRWVSTALVRATVISARTDKLERTLQIARTYHVVSQMWPCSFRPSQQAFMSHLYLKLLRITRPTSTHTRPSDDKAWLVCEIPHAISANIKKSDYDLWSAEWLGAIREGRRLLNEATAFPRAGSINWRVRRFVEDCVVLWETSECGLPEGKEITNILWWSIEMTYHNQTILRHLARLLQATGQYQDAKRIFEIYVQLVLKARQTAQPEVSLELKRSKTNDEAETPAGVAKEAGEGEAKPDPEVETEMDSDIDVVEALLLGARLLTRQTNEPTEAWRYVVLAGDVIVATRSPMSNDLRARVEECKGIIRMAMANEDPDPLNRPRYQAQGINHLKAAVTLGPSIASIQYHLAYAQAETRDIEAATDSIRAAIEGDPTNVAAWHLLALLLTAAKDWSGASKAATAGIATWDNIERDILKKQPDREDDLPAGVSSRDFAAEDDQEEEASVKHRPGPIIVHESFVQDTVASTVPLVPRPSATVRLAQVVKLRMTRAAILDKIQGPEAAMVDQQSTFAFFSARSGYSRPGNMDSPASQDGGSVKDLGESFLSVRETTPAGVPQVGDSVLMPPPRQPQYDNALSRESTISQSIISPDNHTNSEDDAETRSIAGKRQRFLAKHLHVPGSRKSQGKSANSSRRPTPTELSAVTSRPRAISNGSSIRSRGTTPAHSHYHGSRTVPPPPPPDFPSAPSSGRSSAETRLLANLWLQSAASFRRTGKLEQALGAIQEAEVMDPSNPEVWVELGQYHSAVGDQSIAIEATTKALVLDSMQAKAHIRLAELYLNEKQADLAHGLLNPLTQGNGWDSPEAWYFLAKVCEAQGGRAQRVKECLLIALSLEKTRPCRPLGDSVDRWL